ncbi:hypothetical protein [Pseudomonas sp. PGPPP4]|uniref:hypothetical protein n=1 Tax=Pseudomonas sp. PGPPP4 TaxID=2015556 RepID=UPI00257DA1C0|nr:hypothetical protein [Pseudomonas sp. PGPPP4]
MIEAYTQKIFFVDNDFLEDLREESLAEFKEFIEPQVDTQIIKLPATGEQINELIAYMPPSEIRVGNVIAKAGYTDQFGSIDEFAEDYALRKYRLWVQLCITLGAKKVSVKDIEDVSIEQQDKSDLDVGLSVTSPIGSGEAGVKRNSNKASDEVNKRTMGLTAEATGGQPDLEAAEEMLKQYGLFKDDMFRSIYEMRRLKSNQLTKHEFTLDLTKDIKRMFDSSTKAKLSAMSKIYKGRVDVSVASKSLEKARTAMKLSIVVDF